MVPSDRRCLASKERLSIQARRRWRPAVGEIAIKGAIVMKGYWNRPDATAAVHKDGWLQPAISAISIGWQSVH